MKSRVSLVFSDIAGGGRDFFTRLLSPHFDLHWDEPADFIIYSHIGHGHRLHSGIKIYWSQELYGPDWKECDYAIVPHKTDHPRAYYLPIYAFDQQLEPMIRTSLPDPERIRAHKPHFCSLLSAYADKTTRHRQEFFRQLNRRRKVDSAGPAQNNTGFRVPKENRYLRKLEWIRNYRFNIAFENRYRPGWTTEKLVDPLQVHTIPIHWGDPRVKEDFNPESFICADDFGTLGELADYILQVDETPDLYARYLQASPFRENRPSPVYDLGRLVEFFRRIFFTPLRPVTQRRWFFPLTKWRLVKRNKLPGQ
jgi:hypothetical protein